MQQPDATPDSNDNVIADIGYIIGLFAALFLFIAPYSTNPMVRFHALQSIVLSVVVVVGFIVINVLLTIITSIIPFAFFLFLLMPLVWIAVVDIFLAIKAFTGNGVELPVVGPLARKYV
ncbi:MAG: hypothetical protein EXR68_04455 [Dehalococcoidia bacterium]|nr:hypothetical protein [Dehalococcoidia bacterium]